ncbi:mitochondrial inner membrane protein Mpv17-like isoform X2 [Haemaphysalis longicornis]
MYRGLRGVYVVCKVARVQVDGPAGFPGFGARVLLITSGFFVMGIAFVGPILRVWYITLERIVGSTGGGAMVVKKVLLDQGVFTPVFIPSFLTTLGALQGRSWEGIKDMVRTDYLPILKANYMLWPAAQLINFRFVPLAYRVPFASCVALVWNTYLAWKANRTFKKT